MAKRKVEPIDVSDLPDAPDVRFVIYQSGNTIRSYAVDTCPGCDGAGSHGNVYPKVCPVCRGGRVVYTPVNMDAIIEEFKRPDLSIEDVSVDYDFLIRNAGSLGGH